MGEPSNVRSSCNDIFFLILFSVSISVLIATSATFAKKPVFDHNLDFFDEKYSAPNGKDKIQAATMILSVLGGALGFSVVSAAVTFSVIKAAPIATIWTCLISFNVYLWFVGISLAVSGDYIGFAFLSFFAFLHMLWMYMVRNRVGFTAALLGWVVNAVTRFKSLFVVSLGLLIVQIAALCGFVAGWSMFARSMDGKIEENQQKMAGFGLFCLFNMFWTFEIIQNIVHVTTSGTVAAWYYQGTLAPEATVAGALRRALTTSLGSICFGSLLVAIVQTLRFLANLAKQKARDAGNHIAACCCECILSVLEGAVRYFNRYAFVEIAIRGSPYTTAAKDAYALISQQLITMLINDDITNIVLFIASLTAACTGALITSLIFLGIGYHGQSIAIAAAVALVLILIFLTVLFNVVDSGMAAFFVLYATDPVVLHENYEEITQEITKRRQVNYGARENQDLGSVEEPY